MLEFRCTATLKRKGLDVRFEETVCIPCRKRLHVRRFHAAWNHVRGLLAIAGTWHCTVTIGGDTESSVIEVAA